MASNADLKLRYSVSQGTSLRNVENETKTWGEFVERLGPKYLTTDRLTLEQFKALSKDVQNKRKNNGYFVGAQFKGKIRHKRNMAERQLLTFDIDNGTPEILRGLRAGTSGLGDIEYVVYSTRTHGDGAIKLRVVVPLRKLLPHEQFQAISRICAWMIDTKMKAVDPVSFVPSQVMYWPATCADIKPVFIHNEGPLLDVMEVMEDWGPWQDIGMLPMSPRELPLRETTGVGTDPREKRGIVGAFCRSYDIHSAIEEFLSDVYIPSEVGPDGVPQRYSYVPGTSSNGVQVYDDGTKLQSFHGSDPVAGMNVNAFDLVRIHRFSEMDGTKEENDDPRQARSYKAMEQLLREDDLVSRELFAGHYTDDDELFEDGEPADEKPSTETGDDDGLSEATSETDDGGGEKIDWRDSLDLTEKGLIRATITNLVLILRHAPTFKGKLAYNEFTYTEGLRGRIRSKKLKIDHKLPKGVTFRGLEDYHLAVLRTILESPRGKGRPGWGLRVTSRDLVEAVSMICRENSFHPIRDYLNSLEWDGIKRIGKFWIKACHVADTAYHRATARNSLVAAVARVYEPGCKFDFMPVLIGAQGIRKSTLISTLGGIPWSTEMPGHFDDKKKFVEATMGFWFVENGEMTHFRRAADDDAIKAMLSGTVDNVRLSYRRNAQTVERQFVMWGTTNEDEFLRGRHRRIWAIDCGDQTVDTDWVADNRDQLFAEAAEVYRQMRVVDDQGALPLYLTGEAKTQHAERQLSHLLPNENEMRAGMIREWLDMPVQRSLAQPGATVGDDDFGTDDAPAQRNITCAIEIFVRVLGGDAKNYDYRTARAIGESMRFLQPDWRPASALHCGVFGRQKTYRRTQGSFDL